MAIRDIIRRKSSTPETTEHPLASFREEMNRLFDNFWSDWPQISWPGSSHTSLVRPGAAFVPSIELSDGDKYVDLSAELPGLSEKDIDVTLSNDNTVLMLRGEKKFEQEKKDESFYRMERSYGSFRRAVPLPGAVDPEGIEATFKDGVLKMRMPKVSEEKQGIRKIAVKKG